MARSKGFMAAASLFGLAVFFTACSPDNIDTPQYKAEITPTMGQFSASDERFYAQRFAAFVAAIQGGSTTAIYDSTVSFGTDLISQPLNREASSLPDDVLEALTDYAEINTSAVFMIYENGAITTERYFGDTSHDTLINSKSLAKPLGTIAVGRAIKKGFIESLDQKASDFIVEWKDTPKDAVLIRHLLDMRSGLLPQGFSLDAEDVLNRAYLHGRHSEVIIHEYPLIHVPGERYDYSNANAELVGLILERATGMKYRDWIGAEILALIGAPGGSIWMNREGGEAHSGCCVQLTAESYMKLAILVLNDGVWDEDILLDKSFVGDMRAPTPQNKYAGIGVYLGKHFKSDRGAGNPDDSTFGATFHSEPYVDEDMILFDGNGNQVLYIMPSRGIVAMRLGGNPPKDPSWDNSYIPNLIARAKKKK